jgi:uncharacterized RDD family membrane protein YckC
MGLRVSVAAAAVPAVLAALLTSRSLNRRSARRFRAAFIDLSIAAVIAAASWGMMSFLMEVMRKGRIGFGINLASMLAILLSGAFVLLRDRLPVRSSRVRSPGKAQQHLRIVRRGSSPMTPGASVLRNLPLAVVPLFALPMAAPFAALVLVVEIVLIWRHPQGRRLGDYLAGTQVLFRRHGRNHRHHGEEVPEHESLAV